MWIYMCTYYVYKVTRQKYLNTIFMVESYVLLCSEHSLKQSLTFFLTEQLLIYAFCGTVCLNVFLATILLNKHYDLNIVTTIRGWQYCIHTLGLFEMFQYENSLYNKCFKFNLLIYILFSYEVIIVKQSLIYHILFSLIE